MLPSLVTINSELQVFQYKILSNVMCLNEKLLKMKKESDSKCSLCKISIELILHLFCFCGTLTNNVWSQRERATNGTFFFRSAFNYWIFIKC